MPRVHKVTAARKPRPDIGVAVGETYYWWAHRMKGSKSGFKKFSKSPPKPSQLTMSNFWGPVYSLQEQYDDYQPDMEDIESTRDEIASELNSIKDEQESNLSNMPDGLQQGDTGQMIQERIDALDSAAGEIESVDVSFEEPEKEDEEDDDEYAERLKQASDERAQEIWDEIRGHMDLGCS